LSSRGSPGPTTRRCGRARHPGCRQINTPPDAARLERSAPRAPPRRERRWHGR
jgi:hypothetical protein